MNERTKEQMFGVTDWEMMVTNVLSFSTDITRQFYNNVIHTVNKSVHLERHTSILILIENESSQLSAASV
jgi:hypothetical protein